MTSNEEYVGWKTHEWNLLPLQLSSCTHSPSLPDPSVQTLTESSLTDAKNSPEGSQHTEWTALVCPCNYKPTIRGRRLAMPNFKLTKLQKIVLEFIREQRSFFKADTFCFILPRTTDMHVAHRNEFLRRQE